jgi:hypothetical protein
LQSGIVREGLECIAAQELVKDLFRRSILHIIPEDCPMASDPEFQE